MNNHLKTLVSRMAQRSGTQLTPKHWDVLEYAWRFYTLNGVGPFYQNIKSNTGVSRAQLKGMFPRHLSSVYTWVGIPIQTKAGGCKPMVSVEVECAREVYLDHNATTPVREEVLEAFVDFLREQHSYGNPSSATSLGARAFDVVDQARERIARCLAVKPEEIYFVGSGSEGNNLALKGLASKHDTGHIVSSQVEHPSVLRTLEHLCSRGFSMTLVDVDSEGGLAPETLENAIREDTILVSIMAANNEIGTIYPTSQIGEICRCHDLPLVVDAVQAFGKIPLRPKAAGVTALCISGHKIYAPKGVGAVYVDEDVALNPLIHGGSQEFGIRAGTENVAGILALGLAAKLACAEMRAETERLTDLRTYLLARIREIVPDIHVNGAMEDRLPNNLNLGFPGVDSGSLLLSLNQIGVYVSAGSACSAGSDKESHVLKAIGVDAEALGSIRFSLGKSTTRADLDYLLRYLPEILVELSKS